MIKIAGILIPTYNDGNVIEKCIKSILNQETKYEYNIYIINDGSTDNTLSILDKYKNIIVVNIEHGGIVKALNTGLDLIKEKYIIRMDSDDIMISGRIQHQIKYMEKHPDVDILSSGMYFMKDNNAIRNNCKVSLNNLINGNIVSHPATILRTEKLKNYNLKYREKYTYAEDYKLWVESILCGLNIVCEPTPVIYYRGSEFSQEKYNIQQRSTSNIMEEIKISIKNPLTCIITFKNEKDEIEKTVKSIRDTTKNVNILLVNDGSNDSTDYSEVAKKYKCSYIYNEESLGVAGARDLGVKECITPYFVLLDGHMRFYDQDWDIKLINELKNHPKSIISSNTIVMWKNNDGTIDNEDGFRGRNKFGSFGAIINSDEPGWELTSKWNYKQISKDDLIEVPSIMGAVYASSKEHWCYIQGLKMLRSYGNDESMMSIKTWLMGGKCYLMQYWGVGHLYRNDKPYATPRVDELFNQLLLIELFYDDKNKKNQILKGYEKRTGQDFYTQAQNLIQSKYDEINDYKQYIKDRQVMSIEDFLNKINAKYL